MSPEFLAILNLLFPEWIEARFKMDDVSFALCSFIALHTIKVWKNLPNKLETNDIGSILKGLEEYKSVGKQMINTWKDFERASERYRVHLQKDKICKFTN